MNEANFVQENKSLAKLWAERFSKEDLFSQITTLHSLYYTVSSVELKLSINKLFVERVVQFMEVLYKEGNKLEIEFGIEHNIRALTCSLPNKEKTLTCGLPKNHLLNPLTIRHQAGNVFWD